MNTFDIVISVWVIVNSVMHVANPNYGATL